MYARQALQGESVGLCWRKRKEAHLLAFLHQRKRPAERGQLAWRNDGNDSDNTERRPLGRARRGLRRPQHPHGPRVPGANAAVAAQNAGSLVELSRPNAVGTCNTGFNAFGTWPTDEAEEPSVAVNPVRPSNIVAAWIQGPFQDIIAAASFDGGETWQQVPLPVTVCAGGPFLAAGDVWLSFAPNGVLHGIVVAGNSGASLVQEIMKSTDGGLHWAASVLAGSGDPPPDHPSANAEPTNAAFVYA